MAPFAIDHDCTCTLFLRMSQASPGIRICEVFCGLFGLRTFYIARRERERGSLTSVVVTSVPSEIAVATERQLLHDVAQGYDSILTLSQLVIRMRSSHWLCRYESDVGRHASPVMPMSPIEVTAIAASWHDYLSQRLPLERSGPERHTAIDEPHARPRLGVLDGADVASNISTPVRVSSYTRMSFMRHQRAARRWAHCWTHPGPGSYIFWWKNEASNTLASFSSPLKRGG